MAGKRSAKRSKSSGPKKMKKRASSGRKSGSGARPKARSRAASRSSSRPKLKAKRSSRPAARSGAKRKARAGAKPRPTPAHKSGARALEISRLSAGAVRAVAAKPQQKGRARLEARGAAERAPQGMLELDDGLPPSEFARDPALGALPPVPKKRRGKASQLNMLDYPGESLTVGMQAPEFSLPSTLGRRVSLAEFRGKRVILYFYPKDDTPGCTMEACGFRDSFPRIESKDAIVLGVSLDDELSHERFAQKYSLPFPLLSDKDAAVSRQYGTYKEKSLYGRSFWGIERTTFVIDREGKVEHVFRRVKVEGHAEEVMATLAL